MADVGGVAVNEDGLPLAATDAVLLLSGKVSDVMPSEVACRGYDFNAGVNWEALMATYTTMGMQATNLGQAVERVNEMLAWRLSDEEPVRTDPLTGLVTEDGDEFLDPAVRAAHKCTKWLSFTSNMISSGNREVIRYLCQHKMVDVIVTTGGGVEEDVMKCLAPHFMGDFGLKGEMMRRKGLNRLANLIVPNENYVKFEEWLLPVLEAMLAEQKASKGELIWTPSKMIRRFGKEIADGPLPQETKETSVWYWCYKNDIPVFCPALTDGSVGDMIYFHSYKTPGLILDIAQDIRLINDIAIRAKKSGMIILGGGLCKHHTCNANLMRNGADYSIFINTGQEFDGSDSGAKPDEAVSWGKIRLTCKPVKVYADATLVFPLLVAQTFAKAVEAEKAAAEKAAAEQSK